MATTKLIPIYIQIDLDITSKDVVRALKHQYHITNPDYIIEETNAGGVQITGERKFTDITLEGEIYRRLEKKAQKDGKNVLKYLEDLVK